MPLNSQAKKFFLNALGSALNAFVSLIYLIIVTRVNGIDASGVFSVCFSLSLIIWTFSDLGGRIFEVADNKFNHGAYYTLKLVFSTVAFFVALIIGLVLNYNTEKIAILLILMATRFIEALSDSNYAIFQKADRLDLVGISYILKNVFSVLLFFVVDFFTGSLILASTAIFIATLIAFFAFDLKQTAPLFPLKLVDDKAYCLSLLKAVFPFICFNMVIMLIANLPKIFVDSAFPPEDVGYFSILMMIPSVVVLLGQIVIHPLLNTLAESYRSKDTKLYFSGIKKVCLFVIGASAFCAAAAYFLGPWALSLMYGISFEAYRAAMVLIIVSGMFNVFVTLASALLTIMEKSKQQLGLYVTVLIIEALILALGVYLGNFYLIFWLYLAIMVVQFLLFAFYLTANIKRWLKQ